LNSEVVRNIIIAWLSEKSLLSAKLKEKMGYANAESKR
jgi:hypothetical protein